MSQKRINAMIPHALQEVEVFVKNGTVESKYMSAIASFGVSVLQSGIYATKLFYDAKSDNRKKLPSIVEKLANQDKEFVALDKEIILDAITALKLAIRTYKKVDNETSDDTQEAQDE